MTNFEHNEGHGCEHCRQLTVACYLGLWRMVKGAWPGIAVLAVWSILCAVLVG
jgi:hypothetical protein